MTALSTRLHALDALRSFAMLLGVLLHLSLMYAYMPIPFWKIQDAYQNSIFDLALVTIHSFRLEIFLLMSGFFANFLYQEKEIFYFIKNRFIRVFIPLAAGWPLVLNLLILFQPVSVLKNSATPTTVINLTQAVFDQTVLPFKTLPPLHLWFLYYLLIFYGLFLMIILFARIIKINWTFINVYFSKILQSPYHILILSITTLPSLFLMESLWVDIPLTFSPIIRLLTYYGMFFIFGCFLSRQPNLLSLIAKNRWFYFKIAMPITICLAPSLSIIGVYSSLDNISSIIIIRTAYALCTWSLVLCMIGFFQHYFNKENKIIRYISDSSYWIYIIHLPLLIYFQKVWADLPVPESLRPFLVLSSTLAILLISYHYMVRYSMIGTILNGRRDKAEDKEIEVKKSINSVTTV